MKTRTITRALFLLLLAALSLQASAAGNAPLRVVIGADGCPVQVDPDGSCGGGLDRPNYTCKNNNGPVRWAPVSSIKRIYSKSGDGLHNCQARPNQGYYQCIVRGNVNTEIVYDVVATNDCAMDPVILIR